MRILAVILIPYGESYGFWNRDVGLVIRKLRTMGHDAWLVAKKESGQEPAPTSPVIVATVEEMADPAWWVAQKPDAIILNAWSAPRWHRIRQAVASLGVPLVEKLDTDGVKSPRIWFRNALQQNLARFKFDDPAWFKAFSLGRGLLLTLLVRFVPAVMDEKMVRSMSLVPVYAAETPVASARVRRFLLIYHASPMPLVVTIPHPVNTDWMGYSATTTKENILVSVGRWQAPNKGWLMLFATVKKFLRLRPDWKVVIVGHDPVLSDRDREDIAAFGERFVLAGRLEHRELSALYQRSKIYFFPSYWETFNIAAVEALSCGCTVVGPTQLASVSYFTSFRSGTPSHVRSPDHLTDALLAEIEEWATGQRDPAAISRTALELFSAEKVAGQFLHLFENWKAVTGPPAPVGSA